jgi:MtrB/PioB family decaheme-associated outer membrane protein
MMRTKSLCTIAALLLWAGGARAQDNGVKPEPQQEVAPTTGDVRLLNQIDFDVRGTVFGSGSDEARFQRYRDVRDGGTLDRIRLFKDTAEYGWNLQSDHIGYRDQRFSGAYNYFGRLKAFFEWNQIPLFYSQDARTLYDTSTPGTLRLGTAIQTGIQNKTLTLANALTGASTFDLRTRRDIANVALIYTATPNVDVSLNVRDTHKTGEYPWGGSFGIGGAIATELPVPVDHRTTDIGTSLEVSNRRGYAKLAYDASFFRNDVSTLVWDNPQRVTDSPTAGPAQGRMTLWPNTNANTVSAAGGLNLPAHSRASAYVSIGELSNDNPLLPFTINSALASPALARATSDVHATVTTMNYAFTSRPTSMLWFNARYRQYEFDNTTKPFAVANGVNYDTSIVALNKESEPYGQTRHTFDADTTFSPTRYVGFRAGYTREDIDRTYRIIETTIEDIGRASVDLTGLSWITVRGVFEHSKRRGSNVDGLELLAIGEQPLMRHYDIADRDQNRFSAIVQVTPLSSLSFNASAGVGRQDFPSSYFGLRSNDNNVYSTGFDFAPSDAVSLGLTYGFEQYKALQASRTANPLPDNTVAFLNDPTQQFNDPRRDWTDASEDRVHTVTASIDLLKVLPKVDIKVAYDYSRAESTYTYGLAANTVIAAPVPLTPVVNELQRGTIDGRYFVSRHLALGLVYWYDKYRVDDFALGPVASLAQPAVPATPTLMMLGYFYAPYTANSFTVRLTYLW